VRRFERHGRDAQYIAIRDHSTGYARHWFKLPVWNDPTWVFNHGSGNARYTEYDGAEYDHAVEPEHTANSG
jgi:hypothetical protein